MTTPILQLLNVESNYGPVQALRGVSLSVDGGQDRHRAGRERRRQDHHAEDHFGHHRRRSRAR